MIVLDMTSGEKIGRVRVYMSEPKKLPYEHEHYVRMTVGYRERWPEEIQRRNERGLKIKEDRKGEEGSDKRQEEENSH
jgi:hypothetical protein